MKIVGYPVSIEDDKYHRNALLFNIGLSKGYTNEHFVLCCYSNPMRSCVQHTGFVFAKNVESAPFRPILRKVTSVWVHRWRLPSDC